MRIEQTCTKTACDEVHERDSSACSRCLGACVGASYNCNASSACSLSCGSSSACSDADSARCVQQGFAVHGLAEQPGAEVATACSRMFTRLEECKLQLDGVDRSVCAVWGRVERPENAALYDCMATTACAGGDLSTCNHLLPTTLGDEICDGLGAKCGAATCTPEERALLNASGAVWKDDVVAADRSCLSYPTCAEVSECHRAWKNAVRL